MLLSDPLNPTEFGRTAADLWVFSLKLLELFGNSDDILLLRIS